MKQVINKSNIEREPKGQELLPGLRVVFVLRDIEGLDRGGCGVAESTSVAVKARLWRARVKLREALSKYFGVAVKRA
jgi:DNA-directed RNA polymerase specialized sigma24 family protein